MERSDSLELFVQVVSAVELLLCLAVAVVLALRWRERRSSATGSAFGVFAVVALVIASGYFEPGDPTRGWGAAWVDVVVCVLLAIPYLLVRFTCSLGGLRRRTHHVLAAVLVAEWVATLALPPLPDEADPQPDWAGPYIAFVLAAWTLQCVAAAVGLWRAGGGQAAVVRHRMRALSTGGLLLAVTLVVSGSAGSDAPGPLLVATTLVGLLSIGLFAVAFLPPRWLRTIWRQDDNAALSSAERGLMRAITRDEVAETIVPVLGRVLGGGGAALLDDAGRPVHSIGMSSDQLARLTELLGGHPDGRLLTRSDEALLTARLTQGWLVAQAGRLAPVFGDDEALMLDRVGTLVDLALQRADLFDQERLSRRSAEAAHAELETLLYSVSHDLRSPLISVLGYLDVLRQEHGSDLTGQGPHYLERITVNAVYMQNLIADLLELSRIGRSDPPAEPVDLHALTQQVLEGARLTRPQADLQVIGQLPVVRMSDVRARQLLTNLVENALKHGGRDEIRIAVSADLTAGGHLLLRVADNGRGVPAEYRSRVLRVFERLDAARSTSGTGMGLAICKRIVESFGGLLSVEGPPEWADTGTTVEIELPTSVVVEARVPGPRSTGESRARVEESA